MRRRAANTVVAGLLVVLLSPFALLGGPWVWLAILVSGVALLVTGTTVSLRHDRAPEGLPRLVPSVSLHGGVACDNLLLWIVRQESRFRITPDWRQEVLDLSTSIAQRQAEGLSGPPPPLVEVRIGHESLPHFGSFEHLTFPSGFVPREKEALATYPFVGKNSEAHFYLWRHAGAPRPTLICIHGYRMGFLPWDEIGYTRRGAGIAWLHRTLGINVVAVVLPLHRQRALGRRSGEGFIERSPLWTLAAIEQSVWEVRRIIGWLRAGGSPSIGLYGLSMGGLVTALVASCEDGLSCAIPVIPAVRLSEVVWRQLPAREERAALKAGLSVDLIERAWAPVNPLLLQPRTPLEGRMIIAGLGDRVVPPAQAHALWQHWGRPTAFWYNGGHMAWLPRQPLHGLVEAHLRANLMPHRI